jgi:hypothetical protein
VRLRYTITSRIPVRGALLALENAAIADIRLNGTPAAKPDGWYCDKSIGKVALPELRPGENLLEVSLPYGRKIDLEPCYLLGDFSVEVRGIQAVLGEAVTKLPFGDITRLGLAFYGGNLTYHAEVETSGGALSIVASYYRGHLLRVAVDGKDAGIIAFSPYRLLVPGLSAGKHRIDFT